MRHSDTGGIEPYCCEYVIFEVIVFLTTHYYLAQNGGKVQFTQLRRRQKRELL